MFPVPYTPFPNQFRADLRAGKRLIGCWASLAAPIAAEILGLAGFDWILLDGEHSPNDVTTFVAQLMALKGAAQAPSPSSKVITYYPSHQEPSSLLKYLDPDRFWIEPLGASQLATTGVTACGAETIHFGAQINMRNRVEELPMLGEHRPYQIPLLVELHMLPDV